MPLNSCPICFSEEEDDSPPFIALPCNYKVCIDCLSQWITLKISEKQYTIDSRTPCFMADCKTHIPLQEIYQRMPLTDQQRMNEALLQVYFSKEKDIRKCPNSNCQYAGIINTTVSCTSPLQCNLCGSKWRDKQHYTKFEKILDYLKDRSKVKAEDRSRAWIKQRSKKCPSCKVNIEKNGGCDHMICKHCNFEFCWICLRRHPIHHELIHSYHQNFLPLIAIILLLSIFGFIIYSVGIIQTFKFFMIGLVWLISNFCLLLASAIFHSIHFLVWLASQGLTSLNWLIDYNTPFLIQFSSNSFNSLVQLNLLRPLFEKSIGSLVDSSGPFLLEFISSSLTFLIRHFSSSITFFAGCIHHSLAFFGWLQDLSGPFLTWLISSTCSVIAQFFYNSANLLIWLFSQIIACFGWLADWSIPFLIDCLSYILTLFILLVSSSLITIVWLLSTILTSLSWLITCSAPLMIEFLSDSPSVFIKFISLIATCFGSLLNGITTCFYSSIFYIAQFSSSQIDSANLQTSGEYL